MMVAVPMKLVNPFFRRTPPGAATNPGLAQPYFFESEWSAAATYAELGISYCPSNTAVTEFGSLSAFASISEICHIWVSDRL